MPLDVEDAWTLEPEGETETLETKVVWNGVEGVPGYPDERGQVKKKENKSGGIRRNTGLRERSK